MALSGATYIYFIHTAEHLILEPGWLERNGNFEMEGHLVDALRGPTDCYLTYGIACNNDVNYSEQQDKSR